MIPQNTSLERDELGISSIVGLKSRSFGDMSSAHWGAKGSNYGELEEKKLYQYELLGMKPTLKESTMINNVK